MRMSKEEAFRKLVDLIAECEENEDDAVTAFENMVLNEADLIVAVFLKFKEHMTPDMAFHLTEKIFFD